MTKLALLRFALLGAQQILTDFFHGKISMLWKSFLYLFHRKNHDVDETLKEVSYYSNGFFLWLFLLVELLKFVSFFYG
jgi:hypothetical protein